jgi:F0F1-type ATP synthase epsilon subunit
MVDKGYLFGAPMVAELKLGIFEAADPTSGGVFLFVVDGAIAVAKGEVSVAVDEMLATTGSTSTFVVSLVLAAVVKCELSNSNHTL